LNNTDEGSFIRLFANKTAEKEVRDGLPALYPRLWRFAFVLTRNRAAADDLAQAACERALAQAQKYQPNSNLAAWVFTLTRRMWLNDVRANKVRQGLGVVPLEDTEIADGKPDTETNIFAREVFTHVQALPDGQRLAVLLVYVEGHSYREAAEILDIPIGNRNEQTCRSAAPFGPADARCKETVMTQSGFTDADLTAYLDDEAAPALTASITAALTGDVALQARLAALELPLDVLRHAADPETLGASDMPALSGAPPFCPQSCGCQRLSLRPLRLALWPPVCGPNPNLPPPDGSQPLRLIRRCMSPKRWKTLRPLAVSRSQHWCRLKMISRLNWMK
jgi:RNA polymerase sigma-70 factor (ECF subfamily)